MNSKIDNNDKRKSNMLKLQNLETKNISFNILSKASFVIRASRQQPDIVITNKGTLELNYKHFMIEIREETAIIHYDSGQQDDVYTDKSLIDRVRIIT